MPEAHNELFSKVRELLDELMGEDTQFIVIVPDRQQIATTMGPEEVPALLATIVASMLNNNTVVREHIDEDGEEHKDTMN